ncbi:cysteine rich repeat-containing protein [Rhizobium sp. NRK18]|uniref:cysteine rich repeat-containing protein n=1 Tax=Rhizobium sp. NRK18 TaxID=2964667 RepID=UPI0021C28B24|nr:cysteine rich repeat-containing protein [Rhizobium sp. NRK18]MCQ2004252.1 cysteine rich repeat-containing protein [Rhizobium sp. NRK18]
MRSAFTATTICLLATSAAAAQPSYFELMKVMNACKADIQALCPSVEPGEGRILACLKTQQSKVSAGCIEAAGPYRDQADKLKGMPAPAGH